MDLAYVRAEFWNGMGNTPMETLLSGGKIMHQYNQRRWLPNANSVLRFK